MRESFARAAGVAPHAFRLGHVPAALAGRGNPITRWAGNVAAAGGVGAALHGGYGAVRSAVQAMPGHVADAAADRFGFDTKQRDTFRDGLSGTMANVTGQALMPEFLQGDRSPAAARQRELVRGLLWTSTRRGIAQYGRGETPDPTGAVGFLRKGLANKTPIDAAKTSITDRAGRWMARQVEPAPGAEAAQLGSFVEDTTIDGQWGQQGNTPLMRGTAKQWQPFAEATVDRGRNAMRDLGGRLKTTLPKPASPIKPIKPPAIPTGIG